MNYYNRNIKMIQHGSVELYNAITKDRPIDNYIIEPLENNKNYIIENKNARCFLHSIYDIDREIKKAFETVNKDAEILILFGIGCGYYLKYIKNNFKSLKKTIIVEPNLDIFKELLKNNNLNQLMSDLGEVAFIVNQTKENAISYLNDIILKENTNIIDIVYNISYRTLYGEYAEHVLKKTIENMQSNIVNVATKNKFKHLWVINELKNLRSNSINMDKLMSIDMNIPVIIVSGGPSLNKNMHILKELKNKALIIAVGSAIKTLDAKGIIPHFRFVIEGSHDYHHYFESVNTEDIPLIHTSSTNFKLLNQYKGPKIKLVMDTEVMTQYIYKKAKISFNTVSSGFSVANVALNLFCKLNASKIIFIGQDLCYTNNKVHANDGFRESQDFDFSNKKYIETENIYGEKVYTDRAFLGMKKIFENTIRNYPNISFINATGGGLKIEGTINKELRQVADEELMEKYNINEKLDCVYKEDDYSYQFKRNIDLAINELEKELDEAIEVYKEKLEIIKNINKTRDNMKKKLVLKKLLDLEKSMIEAQKNEIIKDVINKILGETLFSISNKFQYKGTDQSKQIEYLERKLAGQILEINEYLDFIKSLMKDAKGEEELQILFV